MTDIQNTMKEILLESLIIKREFTLYRTTHNSLIQAMMEQLQNSSLKMQMQIWELIEMVSSFQKLQH